MQDSSVHGPRNATPRSTTSDGKFWTRTQTETRNHSILGILQGKWKCKHLSSYLLIHSQETYEYSLLYLNSELWPLEFTFLFVVK